MFGVRLWMAALVLLFACESEAPRTVMDAGRDASMDAGADARSADAEDEEDSGGLCTYDAALAETDTTTPHEVFEEGRCPLQRIPADYVLHPTVECWQYPRCDCRRRANGCRSNADCTALPNGVCMGVAYDAEVILYAACSYEQCTSDNDCESGETCACSERGPRICVRADCRSNEDCATGHECLRTMSCASGPFGDYLCTSDADQCVTHEDCANAGLGSWCERAGDHRVCTQHTCSE